MKSLSHSISVPFYVLFLCGSIYSSGVCGMVNVDSMLYNLDNVEISANRILLQSREAARPVIIITSEEIASAPIHSINDLLEYIVGVDVRQRGEMGVQSDISVRGGSFDQVTLLLNGVNISSPHTGHLSADFPLSIGDIERIEVLQGPAARVFGTSAFTGAVNIITKSDSHGGSIHLFGGDFGLAGAEARYAISAGNTKNNISIGGSRSDGATLNSDYNSIHAFYSGSSNGSDYDLSWQLGYSDKSYGANTFYGTASTDQWENNERIMGAVKAQGHGKLHLTPSAYWNRWYDHYQWHRNQALGENFHRVDVYGVSLNSWFAWSLGKSSLGVEMRNENIFSSKLGRQMSPEQYFRAHGSDSIKYRFHDNRTNLSAFIEHNVILNKWSISLGMLANLNTSLDYKFRLYPGVDISYRPFDNWKLFASWNMALRMPTFTDLYYSGVNIRGNDHLQPEKRSELTLGARYRIPGIEVQSDAFISHNSDMIDWVIYQGDVTNTFNSCNFMMNNYGVGVITNLYFKEFSASLPFKILSLSYSYIDQTKSYSQPIISSKYSLEYLRHKVVVRLDSNISGPVNGWLAWRWQQRTGQNNGSYGVVDARVSYDKLHYTIYVEADNLLDKQYYDYSYIPQPGVWVKAGVIVDADFLSVK